MKLKSTAWLSGHEKSYAIKQVQNEDKEKQWKRCYAMRWASARNAPQTIMNNDFYDNCCDYYQYYKYTRDDAVAPSDYSWRLLSYTPVDRTTITAEVNNIDNSSSNDHSQPNNNTTKDRRCSSPRYFINSSLSLLLRLE